MNQPDSSQDKTRDGPGGQSFLSLFESRYSTRRMQMLKILCCFLDDRLRGALAVWIRFTELQIALETVNDLSPFPARQSSFPLSGLFDELAPLCSEEELTRLRQLQTMSENIQNLQEMLQMVQAMRELFPENGENPAPSGENTADLLSGLMAIFGGDSDAPEQNMENFARILSLLN